MKFIIAASDIHHNDEVFEYLCKKASEPDCEAFLYAGDLDYENYFILTALRNRNFVFLPVCGNCDKCYDAIDAGLPDLPPYRTCTFFGKRIFITHGHIWTDPASAGLNNNDFDICISGHTHISSISKDGELVFLNPGSASQPRGYSEKSFAIIRENSEIVMKKIAE